MISKRPSSWSVEFDPRAIKDLRRLGHVERGRVLRYMTETVAARDDPRSVGKALVGDMPGVWRYRVGDLRILAQIEDDRLVVLVVEVGNRREIYR